MKNAERIALWILITLALIGPPIGMRAQNLFNRNDGTFAQVDGVSVAGVPVLLNTILPVGGDSAESDTTHITATYSNYKIVFNNLLPQSLSNALVVRVHSGGSFQSGAVYVDNVIEVVTGAAITSGTATANTWFPLSNSDVSNGAGTGVGGTLLLHNPSVGGFNHLMQAKTFYVNGSGNWTLAIIDGLWNGASSPAIDGFEFIWTAGAIFSGQGKILLYGLP